MAWHLGHLLLSYAILLAASPIQAQSCNEGLSVAKFEVSGQRLVVADRIVKFDNPDSPTSPSVWEGPVEVSTTDGQSRCQITDVGLIDTPLAIKDKLLFLGTSSGSNYQVVILNLQSCMIVSRSPKLATPIYLKGSSLFSSNTRLELNCGKDPP